jgi:hypothetical protein
MFLPHVSFRLRLLHLFTEIEIPIRNKSRILPGVFPLSLHLIYFLLQIMLSRCVTLPRKYHKFLLQNLSLQQTDVEFQS